MFTLEDFKKGKCILVNDGTFEDLKKVMEIVFPGDVKTSGSYKFYKSIELDSKISWDPFDENYDNLPEQSVKEFIKQIENNENSNKESKPSKDIISETQSLNKKENEEFNPKFGEEVLVSNNNVNFYKRIFVAKSEDSNYPFVVVSDIDKVSFKHNHSYTCKTFKYIKSPKVKVSKNEIARWKNCNIEDLEIVE